MRLRLDRLAEGGLMDSRSSSSPRWWNRWTVTGLVLIAAIGVALLIFDFVQIALEVRAMR